MVWGMEPELHAALIQAARLKLGPDAKNEDVSKLAEWWNRVATVPRSFEADSGLEEAAAQPPQKPCLFLDVEFVETTSQGKT